MRSPSRISQRRPLTMVAAPSARVAKRTAAKVWRCGRARSPGSSTVKAPIRFDVVTVSPANAGLTRISARRSISSMATSPAARSAKRSMSLQRQMSGASVGCGRTGVIFLKRSHSGCRLAASSSATKELSAELADARFAVSTALTTAGLHHRCRSVFRRRHLRQHLVDVRTVDDDMLDEDARLDLAALEISGQHIDAEPAPEHRIEFDCHGNAAVFDGA